MAVFIGFVIAVIMGLTGIGGGTFTTPALVLLLGLSAGEAVGTAMVFAAAIRLLASPVYLFRQQVHGRYAWRLILGAAPGLFLGTWLLQRTRSADFAPLVLVVIGAMLVFSSAITFVPRLRNPHFARERRGWLSLIALAIGIETGFSSAGAGALGTMMLLNFSELPPAQVVGTDLLFGIVLAVVGSVLHLASGSIALKTLQQLLAGGIPGVLIGCLVSRHLSGQRVRLALAVVGIALGLQLIWLGSKTLWQKPTLPQIDAARGTK